MGLSQFDEKVLVLLTKEVNPSNYAVNMVVLSGQNFTVRYDEIVVTSSDTVDRTLTLLLNPSTDRFPMLTALIPAGAGTTLGVPSVRLLSGFFSPPGFLAVPGYTDFELVLDAVPSPATSIYLAFLGGQLS